MHIAIECTHLDAIPIIIQKCPDSLHDKLFQENHLKQTPLGLALNKYPVEVFKEMHQTGHLHLLLQTPDQRDSILHQLARK